MAADLQVTIQSVAWAGGAPRLWVEHGSEQRQARGDGPCALRFPFVPSKPIDILAFDPQEPQDERGFIAGASFSVEQVLEQGGAGTVELSDAAGALRGRVQLRAELTRAPAAPRLAPPLLDAAAPTPFADPSVQERNAGPSAAVQWLGERLARAARGSSGGGRRSSGGEAGGGAGAGAPAPGHRPAGYSPLTRGHGTLAARQRYLDAVRLSSSGGGGGPSMPAAPAQRLRGGRRRSSGGGAGSDGGVHVRVRVGELEQAAAAAGRPPPAAGEGGAPRGARPRRRAAGEGAAAGGAAVALLEEVARQGAERRAAGARVLLALAQQGAADAAHDARLLAALRVGGGGGGGAADGDEDEGAGGAPRAASPLAVAIAAAKGQGGAAAAAGGGDGFESAFESFPSSVASSARGLPTPRLGGLDPGSAGGSERYPPIEPPAAGGGGGGGGGGASGSSTRAFRHGYPALEVQSVKARAAAAARAPASFALAPRRGRGGRGGEIGAAPLDGSSDEEGSGAAAKQAAVAAVAAGGRRRAAGAAPAAAQRPAGRPAPGERAPAAAAAAYPAVPRPAVPAPVHSYEAAPAPYTHPYSPAADAAATNAYCVAPVAGLRWLEWEHGVGSAAAYAPAGAQFPARCAAGAAAPSAPPCAMAAR
ncbi:MAG: hypothetical protein J3K34DRAFT_517718 [Monoraphidium minutum]|nr:MAG: hypothetical protein J3K34DRAFT_517718 [Monoraphidium minutum]